MASPETGFLTLVSDAGELKSFWRNSCPSADEKEWVVRRPQDIYAELFVGRRELGPEFLADLALLVILAGQKVYRSKIEHKLARGTRNIYLWPISSGALVVQYLEWVDPERREAAKLAKTKKRKETQRRRRLMEMLRIDVFLREALGPLKTLLQFPEEDDVAHSYRVSEEVLRAAQNPECHQYVKLRGVQPYLFDAEFREICRHVEAHFSEDAPAVIEELKKTESRQHQSLITLDTQDQELFVKVVSPDAKFIRMEGWKFVNLVENHGTARRLGEYRPAGGSYRDRESPLQFNHAENRGDVVAKLDFSRALLKVVLQPNEKTKTNNAGDKANFILDTAYVLSVYVVIKKIDSEKERYARLLQNADTAYLGMIPFLDQL